MNTRIVPAALALCAFAFAAQAQTGAMSGPASGGGMQSGHSRQGCTQNHMSGGAMAGGNHMAGGAMTGGDHMAANDHMSGGAMAGGNHMVANTPNCEPAPAKTNP